MHDLLQIFLSLSLSLNQKPAANLPSAPANQEIVAASPAVPNARLYEMSKTEIDALLRETSARLTDFPSRLQAYSQRALGTPYRWFPLGEGPQAKYDRGPLIDLTRVDCLTFCEQILAMTLADHYEEMFQRLQRLRYREGVIDIRARNHFMMADWLPNNAWLFEDVTAAIGGELCVDMRKTIDRVAVLRKRGVPEKELASIPPPQTLVIKYIPEADLPAIKTKLQAGDLAVVIQSRPGIFAAHLGFLLRDGDGRIFFRNASARRGVKKVVDEDFDDLVRFLRRNPSWVGMVFGRVRPAFMSHPEIAARAALAK
ncbi:MAG: DUF1460 domain-containing protein [candidate division KSB1 bacterium]|nr:DUF1460 domain-containing protein [candidate division KSB1 bacterium]MDZ7368428.1 DUF1460 domain-containing protein [candidate division KSB1 bacterium]MDZ7405996.1 DUF1460 domain-containing protein [candidate division KSB1 bacterium]